MDTYDILIKRGSVFDGLGNPPIIADVLINDGVIQKISETPFPDNAAHKVLNAKGQWVCPGFIDLHTHYDAELMVAPSLQESVRHGVTTCFIGSCSISLIYSDPEDASDIFTRVESIPREYVLPALKKLKTWNDAKGYVEFLKQHPMGPNIASYVGHSDLRTAVMGLGRAVTPNELPTETEMQTMEKHLHDALDQGLLGMSSMTNPWDKVDGDRYRSASLPSVYASWKEYRRLHRLLRKRDSILQSAPNLTTKINGLFFLFTSASLWFRKSLRTTLITLMDPKADPGLASLAAFGGALFNKILGANFKWQALPSPFKVYSDGIDFIVFEEFPTGEMALHLEEEFDRNKLFANEGYRTQFKKEYRKRWGGRVWHRDFGDATIIDCPDKSLIHKSIENIAKEQGKHEVDTFLDLLIDHGRELRWTTVIANHRKDRLIKNVKASSALIGFSDAGAHLRNMAFYNFPLQMLKLATSENTHEIPELTPEFAIWRLTGEIANWYKIDAGILKEGSKADIAIIDPETLAKTDLEVYEEASFKELADLPRVVNRNPGVVTATLINGKLAFFDETINPELGKTNDFGRFLTAN